MDAFASLLGILTVFAVYKLIGAFTPPTPPVPSHIRHQMTKEMIGKSQKECRQILKKYRK